MAFPHGRSSHEMLYPRTRRTDADLRAAPVCCDPKGEFKLTTKHLNQVELSRRWSLSPRTLERWRWLKQGPEYLKIGGRVVYRVDDVEAFEAAQVHRPTPSYQNSKPAA